MSDAYFAKTKTPDPISLLIEQHAAVVVLPPVDAVRRFFVIRDAARAEQADSQSSSPISIPEPESQIAKLYRDYLQANVGGGKSQ